MSAVSIIVPQHGGSQLTQRAVSSLAAHHPCDIEIVVVDDGSDVRERRLLQSALHEIETRARIEIIRLPRRRGVTAAWNAGASAASGDLLVFLNNDTLTGGPWLPDLIVPLQSGACGMTGISWRREPDWPRRLSMEGTGRALAGWCLALRRQTWSALGGFDERFWMYYSDTDLQCRLLREWTGPEPLRTVSGLPLVHLGHRTTRRLPTRHNEWSNDRQRFLRKWDRE